MSMVPRYSASRALAIGIDAYQHCNPLGYAVNEAKAIAKVLIERFGFPVENVQVLRDQQASRDRILKEYLTFARKGLS